MPKKSADSIMKEVALGEALIDSIFDADDEFFNEFGRQAIGLYLGGPKELAAFTVLLAKAFKKNRKKTTYQRENERLLLEQARGNA